MKTKHIVIIGFKKSGKTFVGKNLSTELNIPFIDLEEAVRLHYLMKTNCNCSKKEIIKVEGSEYLSKLEADVLEKLINREEKTIISLDDSTPLNRENQILLKNSIIVHIESRKALLFERIMMSGRPIFFDTNGDPYSCFEKSFKDRLKIYKKLANITAKNNSDIEQTIIFVKKKLCNN